MKRWPSVSSENGTFPLMAVILGIFYGPVEYWVAYDKLFHEQVTLTIFSLTTGF